MSTVQPPGIEEMVFYDRVLPDLTAGGYVLRVEQHVAAMTIDPQYGAGANLDHGSDFHLEITGPRWQLAPGDLFSTWPGAKQQQTDTNKLPMAVLHRRTLPWERDPDPQNAVPKLHGAREYPWLYLLLVKDSEAEFRDGVLLWSVLGPGRIAAIGADGGVLVNAVAVHRPRLLGMLPTVEELRLLAHARHVNVANKAYAGDDPDAWFAVLVGNRLPLEPETKYHACIVSLEGQLDLLPHYEPDGRSLDLSGSAPSPPRHRDGELGVAKAAPRSRRGSAPALTEGVFLAHDTIPLVVLHRWDFATGAGGDFESRMNAVSADLIHAPHGNLPLGEYVELTGYTDLEAISRKGERYRSLYRGPLVPLEVAREERTRPFVCADEARFDVEELGMEDLSLAAAFEVGRLLALSDPQFTAQLMRWRRFGWVETVQYLVGAALRNFAQNFEDMAKLEQLGYLGLIEEGFFLLDRLKDRMGPLINPVPVDLDVLAGLPTQVNELRNLAESGQLPPARPGGRGAGGTVGPSRPGLLEDGLATRFGELAGEAGVHPRAGRSRPPGGYHGPGEQPRGGREGPPGLGEPSPRGELPAEPPPPEEPPEPDLRPEGTGRSGEGGLEPPGPGAGEAAGALEVTRTVVARSFADLVGGAPMLKQTDEIPPPIKQWLARLRVLHGVPFEYLVPKQTMLPNESIRFFYLDRNWTDALVDGAFSVGQVGSREEVHDAAFYGKLRVEVDQYERKVRARHAATGVAHTITGFLMRSLVIKFWPGLEVSALKTYRRSDGQEGLSQIYTLRQDRLSSTVLLCLFEEEPDVVRFEEPREELQLGVDGIPAGADPDLSGACLDLKAVACSSAAPPAGGCTVTVPMRTQGGERSALNIAGLREELASALPGCPVESAMIAFQVLQMPYRLDFRGAAGASGPDFTTGMKVRLNEVLGDVLLQAEVYRTGTNANLIVRTS